MRLLNSSRLKELKKTILNEPHNFFIVVGLVFGLLFVALTPPLQGPDEQAHFAQAFKYSEANFFSSSNEKTLPKSLKATYDTVFYNDQIRFFSTERYEHSRTREAFAIPLNLNDREFDNGYVAGTAYSPIGYLPASIMIVVGKLFNTPPIGLLYLARIGGLISWLVLIYFAIRISPIGKWAISIVGILPMLLFQAAVVTVDTLSFASLILLLSYALNLTQRSSRINLRQLMILLLLAAVSVLSKQGMIFILPIVAILLFGKNKQSFLNKFVLVTSVLVVSAALMLAWTSVGGTMIPNVNLPEGVQPSVQIGNFFSNPTEFIYALWNTNFFTWGDSITRSFMGTFGWMDTQTALWITILGYVVLVFAIFSNRAADAKKIPYLLTRKVRFLLFCLTGFYFLSLSAILYAYNTPVNFNIIYGLQGRYFLPMLLPLIIAFANDNEIKLKPFAELTILRVLPIVTLSLGMLTLFIRYYVNTAI